MLNKANLYWVPIISNFSNINAAFLCEITGTLACLQHTNQTLHKFSRDTFKSTFIDHLPKNVLDTMNAIEIYFVVPLGVSFENKDKNYNASKNLKVKFNSFMVDARTDDLIGLAFLQMIDCLRERHHEERVN